jgi:hypothetical protein
MRSWRRNIQDLLVSRDKVRQMVVFSTMANCLHRWRSFGANNRAFCKLTQYRQSKLKDRKHRCIVSSWKALVSEHAAKLGRVVSKGVVSALCSARSRRLVMDIFGAWRSSRACHRTLLACKRRQYKVVTLLEQARARGMLQSCAVCWREVYWEKQLRTRRNFALSTRCRGRLRRIAFHCWYAVRQVNKVLAQKWWWENKFETLTKSIEVHEQSCSHQDRTMQACLDDTCKLEDQIVEMEGKIDKQRASNVQIRLECSGLIRMLSFAICRLYYSVSRIDWQNCGTIYSRAELQGSSVVTVDKPDSETAAVTAVIFSVWSCVLVFRRTQEVKCAEHGRRHQAFCKWRVMGRWRNFVKHKRKATTCANVVARRRDMALARRFMRRWSGSYFTFSAFLKIRKCRARHLLSRIARERLSQHWRAWQVVCQYHQHLSLVLQRAANKACRQVKMRYLTAWYLLAKADRKTHAGDSMWLLDASRVEHHETSTKRRPDAEAGVTLGRPGVLEQSVDALCLLTAREMELRDVREELHRRDEGFAHLRAALAESESQVASMRDELSSKMVVSELDESAALERVEALTMQTQNAEKSMRELRSELTRMSEAGVMLERDLENARDHAADARRDLKGCKRDLAQAQQAMLEQQRAMQEQQELIQQLRQSAAGVLEKEHFLQVALAGDPASLAMQPSDALTAAQLVSECEALKGQLEARDVTERELRATLAQRFEGDAVMGLRGDLSD